MAYIQLDRRDDGVVVTPTANLLGGDETDELAQALEGLATERPTRVVVDLSRVELMNSTATAVLLHGARTFGGWGQRIVLRNLNGHMRAQLEIIRVVHLFDIETTPAPAADTRP